MNTPPAAAPEFTAHNIRLDDGTLTKPSEGAPMSEHHLMRAARKMLDLTFPGDKSRYRVADLGCLEGGYSVELARMGFQVLGLEVRESNLAACRYVKARTRLPNLEFVQDDAWNIARYGRFDAIFCCGLFYHLDRPRAFLELLSGITSKLLLLYTHFGPPARTIDRVPQILRRLLRAESRALSAVTEHEGLAGRWFTEFASEQAHRDRETAKWASWDNTRSFWIQREHLLEAIYRAGFDTVLEQLDSLAPEIASSMIAGDYRTHSRGTFVGIKSNP